MMRASFLLVLCLSSTAFAQPVDLHRIRESLGRIQERLESGVAPEAVVGELQSIRSGYERRVVRLEAEIARVEALVSELGLGAVAAERVERAREAFERSELVILERLTRLAASPELSELEPCIEALAPVAEAEREELLSAQELPLRELDLEPPPLSLGGPATTSSFAADGAGPADPIGSVPREIQELAAQVEGAVSAYELVKNQTRFELYFGSMKGSVQTLREGSGNDADIARLLVELLRAEGIPARYVRGVVRLSIDQAKNWIGTELAERVEGAFTSAAVPYEPRFAGGGISGVDKEHVWVEAYVPWANYRGVGVDSRGRRWVPLDASFKFHDVDEGHPVLEEMGFDSESFVREALEGAPQTDPMVALRSRVTSFLNANVPGTSFEAALRKVVPRSEVYGILPASLPYEVVSIASVSFDFPEELEHRVRFVATRRDGEVILDGVFPVPRLMGRRLTLSYAPAEEEDRAIAESFGSLYQTPPFLVRVRPIVRSAGLVVASGGAIEMGGPFELETSFLSPAGSVKVSNRMIAGAYAALAISGRTPGYEERAESQAGEILNQRALDYLARWNEIDRELAGLTRVLTFRPLPSHVLVKNAVGVEYATDGSLVPLTFEWKGIEVDADLRPVAAIAAESSSASRREFYLLSGLMGSELEGRILEEGLGINAVSTVELLRLASSRGVEVREIDRANADAELATIDLEPELESAIASHAHLGRVVRAPVSELTFLAWTGGGFTAWEPSTGESAYMLSGRLAGSTSTDDPDEFPPSLRDALKDPTEPVSEPSQSVGAIEKVDSTDFQEVVVGREALFALEVVVTDGEGEPIADGVPVTFRAVDEGSLLASEDLVEEGKVIKVPTRGGRARARLRMGTSTRDNPRFLRENPGDEFLTQVGLYRVAVEAGDVEMEQPFAAFALPDDERDSFGRHGQLLVVSGRYARVLPLISGDVPMWVEVVDPYRNPLSNMKVDWEVLAAERLPGVPEPLPDEFENAKIESEEGELLERDQRNTSYLGSRIFARLGDVDSTRYKVAATSSDPKYPREPLEFIRDSEDLSAGRTKPPMGEVLVPIYINNGFFLRTSSIVFESGGRTMSSPTLTMGPAGGLLPGTVEFQVSAYQESYEAVLDERGKWVLEGRGRFTRRDVTDATVTPRLLEGDGSFQPRSLSEANGADGISYGFQFGFGEDAGMRRYSFSVEAKLNRPVVSSETGEVVIQQNSRSQGSLDDGRMLFGVIVRTLPQSPDPFVLDSSGHLAAGSTLGFEILPSVVDEALSEVTLGRVLEIYENGELFAFGDLPRSSPQVLNVVNGYDPKNVYQARVVLLPGTGMELWAPKRELQFFHAFMKSSKPRPILVREFADPEDPAKTKLLTPEDALLEYFIRPSQLPVGEALVELIEVDRKSKVEQPLLSLAGSKLEGEGAGLLGKGFEAKPVEKEYKAVLKVTPQGRAELRSEPQPIRFTRLLYEVRDPVRITFQSGASQVCFVPEAIVYGLEMEADVTISVLEIEGSSVVSERVVFHGREGISGAASFVIGPQDVANTAATYRFRIQAVAAVDSSLREEYIGSLRLDTTGNVVLPVGHTFAKGVDLLDGHLVSSSTDVTIPGRGPALEVVRTYANVGNSDGGVLGAGWSMNYLSTLVISSCAWTVVGGDGSGQSFTRVGERFVPQKGYHTELVRNDDGSFDFFTKGRVRYHYLDVELFEGEEQYAGRPTLSFIEDPNGNRLELFYDSQRNITRVKEVFQGGVEGRSLAFEYVLVLGEPRLKRVRGPMNLEVTYEYDEHGNLIEAKRDERVERYEYDVGNLQDRHNLVGYTDPNGNVTRYEYFRRGEAFPGETPDTLAASKGKFEWVKRVFEPEGATSEFLYDFTEINAGFFKTTVTDARRNVTLYRLNLNGSPVRIEEPGGVVTTMTWAANDIFKESETDANGRLTHFEYDERGNLTKERMLTSDRGEVVTEFSYHPVFNKMTLKRVHNDVLQETRFVINDLNGNLEEVTDAESNVTTYGYLDNGDLQSVRGPRGGQVTELAYDDFGNPFTTTDAEDNVTTTVYDARSRLTSSRDTLGRSLSQDFDGLDRVTSIVREDDEGSSDTEVLVRDYYPGGQVLLETNGLGLTTYFIIDGLNRVTGTRDDLGHTTTAKYDGNGNVVEKTDRRGVTTFNTYDELNRLTKAVVGPSQTVAQMDYDAVGNKLFEIDLYGSRTDFEYDGLYRVKTRHLPTQHRESFTYDNVGNKLTETDANGNPTAFGYDRLNRLTSRLDADGNRIRFDYDASGNRTLEEDVTRGLETTTLYDFLNRPLTRTVTGAGVNSYETTWGYLDSEHRVVETDPRGFAKTATLDGFDRVHEVRQDTGTDEQVTVSFYDANGNLKRTVDAETRTTVFAYDGLNRLTETRDAAGNTMSYEYDGEGNKLKEVSRRSVTTEFRYDNLGRLTRTVMGQPLSQKAAITTSTFYNDLTRERFEFDARGNRTSFLMDERQRVVRITDADGKTQTFEYDGVNKTAEVDKRAHRTEFGYDRIHRLIQVSDPLGQLTTTEYQDEIRRVVELDKKSIQKTTQLDALGRLVSVTRSNVRLEEHEYDGNSNRVLSTDANGNQTQFVYDGVNRLTARTDAPGTLVATTTTLKYDRVGNLLEEKDGRVTGKTFDVRNTYDDLNRMETTEDGEGNVTTFGYDPEGNRTAVIEPKGPEYRTQYKYGELNELLEVRMPDGGLYRYDYDATRNRTRQEDGEGNVVRFTYDKLNRMERMIQDPLNYVTLHEYDPNGNEIKLTDPKGQIIDFDYDELNRLKFKVYNLTVADLALFTRTHRIDYDYDPNDNLIRVDETKSSGIDPPAVVSSFKTYDDLDRLETETDAWGRRLVYGYDPQGNRTLLIDPDQKRTVYEYDALNRVETLTLDDGQVVGYEYFPDGLKQRVINPNGTASTYLYDAADRMTDISHVGPTGTISSYEYFYDASSNRERQVEQNAGRMETTEYTYDFVNRLKTVTYPDRSVRYEYDQAGNRIQEVTTGAEASDETFHYDAINRLERITDNLGDEDVVYSYDANGNTTSKTKGGITTTFHYDIRDQLGEVRQASNILGRYGYDYNGRRILKIGDDGRRQYTYDQLSVITEADQVNSTVSKYDYGMDQLVRLDNRNEGRSFFHLDFLGSTVSLTAADGVSRQSIFYDAWGDQRDRIGASANNFTFTGHEKDEETNLLYAKARFYDADIGRFLSQDSFLGVADKAPTLHRYLYGRSNPIMFFDPDGNQSLSALAQQTEEERKQRRETGQSARRFEATAGGQIFDADLPTADIKRLGFDKGILTPDEQEAILESAREEIRGATRFKVATESHVSGDGVLRTTKNVAKALLAVPGKIGEAVEAEFVAEARSRAGTDQAPELTSYEISQRQGAQLLAEDLGLESDEVLKAAREGDTGRRITDEGIEITGAGVRHTTRIVLEGQVIKIAVASTLLIGAVVEVELTGVAAQARWAKSRQGNLGVGIRNHFRSHGHQVGATTAREYDFSARYTIQNGRSFTYRDRATNEFRVGYWDSNTGLFTATSQTRSTPAILTHYPETWEGLRKLPGFSAN